MAKAITVSYTHLRAHETDTEASLISYELFLKNEWKIIRKEKVIINNIFFERYKMTKIIKIN